MSRWADGLQFAALETGEAASLRRFYSARLHVLRNFEFRVEFFACLNVILFLTFIIVSQHVPRFAGNFVFFSSPVKIVTR